MVCPKDYPFMLIVGRWRHVFILLFFLSVWLVAYYKNLTLFLSDSQTRQYLSGILWMQVMAGSGHLQTFRLLKFLRNRHSADGHAYFGTQMAVSLLNKESLHYVIYFYKNMCQVRYPSDIRSLWRLSFE